MSRTHRKLAKTKQVEYETIRNENKIIVQFSYPDKEGNYVFITRSDVMRDKLTQYKEELPFMGTVTKVKDKYVTIQ